MAAPGTSDEILAEVRGLMAAVGHLPYVEAPAMSNTIIGDFLRQPLVTCAERPPDA